MLLSYLYMPVLLGFAPITVTLLLGCLLRSTDHDKSWNPVNRVLLRMKSYFREKLGLGAKGIWLRELFDFSIHAAMPVGAAVWAYRLKYLGTPAWVYLPLLAAAAAAALACAVYYYGVAQRCCARLPATAADAAGMPGAGTGD